MKRHRRRGILLIMTLIILALSTMLISAGLTLNQANSKAVSQAEDSQLAQAAAQAGVEYARTRLQEDPNWKGGTGDSVVVNMPGTLWVRENRGNVVGILGSGAQKSVFRIRFNYQNGTSTPSEGLSNPAPEMFLPMPYVSANNLNSASQLPVYRANSGGSWAVTGSSSSPYDCTRYTAVIVCEGLAGPPLLEVSPTNLAPTAGNRRLSRKVVEAFLGRDLGQVGDSPIYGAQSITMNLQTAGQVKVRSSDHGVPPRARTLRDIYMQDSTNTAVVDMTSSGEAYVNQVDGVMRVNGADSTAPEATREDSAPRFPKVTWSQIAKAPPSSTNLAAGTYVWRRTPRRLDYYAQEYDPAVGPPPASVTPDASYTSSSALDPTGNVSMHRSRLRLEISQDLYVAPAGSVRGLAIVPEPGLLAAVQNRPNVEMIKPNATAPAPIVTAQGDIFVQGSLRGEGSVTTEGNITFQGTSVLEADQNSRTAIYAKGDVTLEPLPPEIVSAGYYSTGSGSGSGSGGSGGGVPAIPFLSSLPAPPFGAPGFQDIAFSGLFYTQGSIRANFPGPNPADLYFRGMVVAFGGDPDLGEAPGASGRGAIDVTGGNVYLEYDSRYVVGALNLTGAALLEIHSYNTF